MPTAGLDLRSSSGYVTDDTGNGFTYLLQEAYDVTRDGITFGYTSTSNVQVRDRFSGNDARIAGVHWLGFASDGRLIRLDLPNGAGTYDLNLAFGDNAARDWGTYLYDGATAETTYSGSTTGSNSIDDINGSEHAGADWPSNFTTASYSFDSTYLQIDLYETDPAYIMHIGLEWTDSSSTPLYSGHLNKLMANS